MVFLIPYFLVLLYPIIGSLKEKENKYLKTEYAFIIFLLFAGLRGNGDGDYFNYIHRIPLIRTFNEVITGRLINGSGYPFEIGFRFIAYINNLLKVTPQLTIFVMNLISLNNIRILINRYSKNKFLSYFLYFPFLILFDMHHSRNAVAMSFVLFMMFTLIFDNKILKSLLYALLAFSYHKSSIVAIGIIYLYYAFNKLIKASQFHDQSKLHLGSIGLALFVRLIVKPKQTAITLGSRLSHHQIFLKMTSYLKNERWSYPFMLYDPRLLILVYLFILSRFYFRDKYQDIKHYLNFVLISILCIILLSESTMLTMRLYNYFNLVTIFIIPELLGQFNVISVIKNYKDELYPKSRKGRRNIFSLLLLTGYFIYFIALIFKQVPYYLFFLN